MDSGLDAAVMALFAASPTPGYLTRRQGDEFVLVALNAAARAYSPLTDDMIGFPLSRLYRDQPETMAAAFEAYDGRTAVTRDLTVRRLDRTERSRVLRLTFAHVPPTHLVVFSTDVTPAPNVERELREAEARNESIVSSTLEGVVVIDAAREIVLTCNEAAARLGGRTRAELLGGSPEEIGTWVGVDGAPLAGERPWQEALRTGTGVRARKLGIRAPSGEVRWCLVTAQPVRRPGEDHILAIACTLTDVTELEASVEALRESEAKYRAILESSVDGVWSTDLTGRTRFVNAEMARMLGTTVDAMTGQSAFDFFAPAQRQAFEARLARRAQGLTEAFEAVFTRRDGTEVWTSATAAPVREGGRVVATVAMFRDLSLVRDAQQALRKSQQWLDTALTAGRMGVFELDLTTQTGTWSPGLDDVFGRQSSPGIQPFLDRVHPADRERLGTTLAAALAAPGKSFDVEYRLAHTNGEMRWARTTGHHVVDGDKRMLVGAIIDVSERRQLEEALSRSRRLESLGRLAGGVAHDFNNLLTVILASIALSEPEASPTLREELGTMKHAAERARDLTRQLLAFARRQVVELSIVDLNGLVNDMEQMLRRLLGEDVEIRTRLDRHAGRVRVDASQVEQVVMNLVVNARDAMPHGGRVEIETTSEVVDAAASEKLGGLPVGSYVVLRVRDTGTGMDARTREHAFEPFFTTKSTGTGLGLASSYGIAQQLGGTIAIESELGKGSTFSVYLPRASGGTASERPRPSAPDGRPQRVLLVEDDRLVRTAGQRILERLGYRAVVASSGEHALEVMASQTEPVDLLMTDMVMPGISGPDLVRQLRERLPHLPVLVVSGHAELDLERIEGARYLQKPYTMESLGARIRELLSR
jgi:PAS domain S-box-containing protein